MPPAIAMAFSVASAPVMPMPTTKVEHPAAAAPRPLCRPPVLGGVVGHRALAGRLVAVQPAGQLGSRRWPAASTSGSCRHRLHVGRTARHRLARWRVAGGRGAADERLDGVAAVRPDGHAGGGVAPQVPLSEKNFRPQLTLVSVIPMTVFSAAVTWVHFELAPQAAACRSRRPTRPSSPTCPG